MTKQSSSNNGNDPNDGMTQRAIRGTLLTLLLRVVSFVGTQWTLRFIGDNPAILGRASIQLELLLTTILFVSREGFRLALTPRNRVSELASSSTDSVWNVAWLSIPTSLIVSLVALSWHWMTISTTSNNHDADYRLAGVLFCVSCIIEGCAEPAVLQALCSLNVAAKASAEGLATLAKAMATVVLLQYLQRDWPITAFGVAQLVYATIYFVVLWQSAWKSIDRAQVFGPYDKHTCYMIGVFTLQGFFKHLLTEGDKLVLTTLSGAYDQGIYAMASAYGSLAARMLLQPMEENARLLWSRLASAVSSESNETLDRLQTSYTNLVKLVMYIGFTFSCLAVNYTGILLAVMAGRKWGDNREAAAVLSAFCVYTAFMAWNGMTEAFVYSATSTGADMGKLGAMHAGIAVVFAGVASIAVTRQGTVGLVAANCVAMFCRAIYSVVFAARFFSSRRKQQSFRVTMSRLLHDMLPHPAVLLSFAACYIVTAWSRMRMMDQIVEGDITTASAAWFRLASEHVVIGASCFVGLLSVAYAAERDFRLSLLKLWRGKSD